MLALVSQLVMLKLFPFLFLQVVVTLLLLFFVRMLLLLLQFVERLNLSPSGVNQPLKICPALFELLVVAVVVVLLLLHKHPNTSA